jgi:hypothetical protein
MGRLGKNILWEFFHINLSPPVFFSSSEPTYYFDGQYIE